MDLLGSLTKVMGLLVGLTSDFLPFNPTPQADFVPSQVPQAPTGTIPNQAPQVSLPLTGDPQSAEELLETLRIQFSRAAVLYGINITSPKYDSFEEVNYIGSESFDFIIVGGGSAGSVLANRLSESSKFKILLLEAGDVGDFLTELPGLATLQQFGKHDWGFFTEVQPNMALGLKDRRMHYLNGKGLGGSSLTDYMEYTRGNKVDYDIWASLGNPGWSYADVLPYFKKFEDSRVKLEDVPYRYRGGQLTVEDVSYRSVSVHSFVEACRSLGYSYVDYNGANQIGVSYVQATTKNGLRWNAEKAYLRPAKNRPNLTIRTKSFVTKILIDDKNVAYGVEYVRNGIKCRARALKEVILSAGVIKSPQLLMLSGVGPKLHLEQLGIPVKKDLAVGEKLYDHMAYLGLTYKLKREAGIDESTWYDPASFVELHKYGRGPLTSIGGIEGLAFVKTSRSINQRPDVALKFLGIGISSDNGIALAKSLQISDEYYSVMFKHLEKQPVVTIMPILLHPRSHGCLKLRSANPLDHPKLYGNYLTDPKGQDMKNIIAGIREAQRILMTPAFQQLEAVQNPAVMPGCEKFPFDSDPYLECAVRSLAVSTSEYVGACKMGPRSDPEAVVDPNLRVYGIKNIRVVDSSVIPIPLSGQGSASAYMLGEKGADIIKQYWWKYI